jgi:hypothetical protein
MKQKGTLMGLRSLCAAALVTASTAIGLCLTSAPSAYADGKVTWQSQGNNNFLEVYQSSWSQGAPVGTWPWNGTDTQYWYDGYLGFGSYYKEKDYNTYLHGANWIMTAYNTCSQGVTQWAQGIYTTQEWKEDYVGSVGWLLINYGGCDGDPYTDMLYPDPTYYNVYLYRESGSPPLSPYWK